VAFTGISVKDVMTRDVKTIEKDSKVRGCVAIMHTHRIGCVVVVEGRKPVGIFTERDLVRIVASERDALDLSIEKVMSTPLTTISSSASIWDAVMVMGGKGIRRLPAVERETLVGIVTEKDIFRLVFARKDLILEAISESLPFQARADFERFIGQSFGTGTPRTR
jgi:CBS domain-containing protein